ncbi:MAG: hypothetical protein K2X74_04380, partial [Acetobacteraceae bacterium]|nr:hypothetical protein [Acetobacteraceae bacterium]
MPAHPLAEAAGRHGLGPDHLAVIDGPAPLPVLLLRAEPWMPQDDGSAPLALRLGVEIDARAMPGRRHQLRGSLLLRIGGGVVVAADLGGLEWRGSGPWA